MSLTKVNYIDNSTIITAQNLNDIQDNIIELNKLEDKIIYGKGKNLLKNTAKSQTVNGVTFKVNADGSVTVNGTATNTTIFVIGYVSVKTGIDYICNSSTDLLGYSFRLDNGATVIHDFATNNTYTPNSDNKYEVCIRVGNGKTVNETSYPMVRLASEPDDTYEPYYEGLKYLTNRGMELLWENASPTSEFGNTRINIDLSGFDFVDVEFRAVTTTSYMSIFRNRVGSTTNCVSDNNGGKIVSRLVISYSDRVIFQKGYIYNTYGAYTENNAVLIPVRIYGIKGVFA